MLLCIKKIYNYNIPYLKIFFLFLVATGLLKLFETIFLLFYEDFHVFQVLIKSLIINYTVCAFYGLLIFPFFALINWFSKKTAIIITSLVYALFFFTELGLSIYSMNTGALMDDELLIRPVSEIIATINASIHFSFVILIIATIFSGFILLSFYIQKKKIAPSILIILLISSFLSPFCIHYIHNLSKKELKPNVENYIVNKSWFCGKSCMLYLKAKTWDKSFDTKKIKFNKSLITSYINEYPSRIVPDATYPLERYDHTPNVLAPFFTKSKKVPNIVIIVVESLGRDWSGINDDGISFTPYLDSLSNSSLYWSNCISTTSRSFGAVPAIIGSVPYGMKGFQFGNMPQNNSLISILNKNQYQTNAFYGGDFSFDCISEYLTAEKTDYLSPFYQEYKSNSQFEQYGNWWGFFDHVMFKKSFDVLNNNTSKSPFFNLFITLTAHEDLKLNNKDKEDYYIKLTEQIINKLPKEKQKKYRKSLLHIAAMVYTDDCLRTFMQDYRKRPDFTNTIFIITGDHSAGLDVKNRLAYHHVPLIIWSPLLKSSHYFPAVISHTDITPTLVSLLKNNYSLKTPEYVHWIGDGLDTSSTFRLLKRMVFISYSHEIREMLYDNYYYHTSNIWEQEAVYQIDKNLSMKKINNDSLLLVLRNKLSILKYINIYTYHANKLTKHPLYKSDKYYNLFHSFNKDTLNCFNPDEKPSIKTNNRYYLLSPKEIALSNQHFKKIILILSADIKFYDSLFQDEYMDLEFYCKGISIKYPSLYKDKIVKFIPEDTILKNKWYKLQIRKEFIVNDVKNVISSISIASPIYDNEWVPNSKLCIKNIDISILGIP